MKFTIETANPDLHYDALARFLNHFEPDPIAAADIREWDRRSEGHIVRRSIVRNDEGDVIAYGVVHHGPWNQPHEFYLWIGVAATERRQGMGQALYDHALTTIRSHDGTALVSEVGEDQAAGLRFAQRQGFVQHKHTFQSKLDLHQFDESAFSVMVDGVQAQGIRLYSLADVADTPTARRQLYAINQQMTLQDPGVDGPFPAFEQFEKDVFAAPWYRPAGQWLAADGDHVIGMCAVGYFQESNSMYNMMTGVAEAYRGRGIAQALKVQAIRWAKAYGADYIRTNNNSENAPMLAINRKLGYEPQPGSYKFTKTL
jgi:GNAT superfamily N-acetyltransferase